MILSLSLLGVLFWACFAGTGTDYTITLHRRTVACIGLGYVVMGLHQDWWAVALWTVLCFNALRLPLPAMRMSRMEPGVMLYALYVLGAHALTPDAARWLLYGLASFGTIGAILWWCGDQECGQKQYNHAESLMVLSMAACGGLAWEGSSWWLLGAFPALQVVHWNRYGAVGQAGFWIWHVCLLAIGLTWPPVAAGILVVYLPMLAVLAYPLRIERFGVDGGRVRIWWILLYAGLWKCGWPEFFFGHGWQSWAAWADNMAQLEEKKGLPNVGFFLHPHSEYVHLLFEHGVVGCVLALGWMGSLLVHAYQGGPLGQAMLFPAVAIGSVALTSFPWTPPDHAGFGSMGLVVASLIVAILLGGL